MSTIPAWWAGNGLRAEAAGLSFDGRSLRELAAENGTPLYVYSLAKVRRRVDELRAAFASRGLPFRLYYAMKANRFRPVLATIRGCGDVGIDACSPREFALARETGFAADEISVTASMLSDRDLDFFAAEGAGLNLDSLSAIRRWGRRVPRGTAIGLRLDCAVDIGYGSHPKLAYGNTKFGFAHDAFDAAVEAAGAAGLVVDRLHVHCGWGIQRGALHKLEWVMEKLAGFARRLPDVRSVNLGGGLGARRRAADDPVMAEEWAEAAARHLGPLGVTVACEPGTLLVDAAGVLVVEVNTVEEKSGTVWIGVDAGHNVNLYAAHYGLPVEIAHVDRPLAPVAGPVSVAGNINESNDIFARDLPLPAIEEGDLLAFLPAGAYGSSMASDHCLRGPVREIAL